jgi:hypothetical protein
MTGKGIYKNKPLFHKNEIPAAGSLEHGALTKGGWVGIIVVHE